MRSIVQFQVETVRVKSNPTGYNLWALDEDGNLWFAKGEVDVSDLNWVRAPGLPEGLTANGEQRGPLDILEDQLRKTVKERDALRQHFEELPQVKNPLP